MIAVCPACERVWSTHPVIRPVIPAKLPKVYCPDCKRPEKRKR